MKILHLHLISPYFLGQSYQENMICLYQSRLGHDVEIFVDSNLLFDYHRNKLDFNNISKIELGVKVTPIRNHFSFSKLLSRLGIFRNLRPSIQEIKPDLIFVHNLSFLSILSVAFFARKNKIILFVDNHTDVYNSNQNSILFFLTH